MNIHDLRGGPTQTLPGGFKVLFGPTGQEIAHTTISGEAAWETFVRTLGSIGDPRRFAPEHQNAVPEDWTRGFLIVASSGWPWAFPSDGEEPFPVFEPDGEQRFEVQLSPDENWVAYRVLSNGGPQVRVQRFRDAERYYSIDGGEQPRWGPEGSNELFYVARDGRLMVVNVRFPEATDAEFDFDAPVPLFDSGLPSLFAQLGHNWDMFPSGQEFLIRRLREGFQGTPLTVIQNWKPPNR
jgi:hypothetical protein